MVLSEEELGVFDEHFQCVKLFNVTSLFPSNTINTVYMDSQNRMWIGTGEGLVCFPSSQSWDYKVYRSEEGLSNVHIRAIMEDASRAYLGVVQIKG